MVSAGECGMQVALGHVCITASLGLEKTAMPELLITDAQSYPGFTSSFVP